MTDIGTVINEGDEIPADVTGLFDGEDDPWFLVNGHWHGVTEAIRLCLRGECVKADCNPLDYAPLYVAAVRS